MFSLHRYLRVVLTEIWSLNAEISSRFIGKNKVNKTKRRKKIFK